MNEKSAPAEPATDPAGQRPSVPQILAGVLTAVTSTLALSYLGVAGTIVGAAIASVLTVLANYWYTRSIVRTTQTVSALAPRVIGHPRSSDEDDTADDADTGDARAAHQADATAADATAALPAARPGDTAVLPVAGETSPGEQPGEYEPDEAPDAQTPDDEPAKRDHHSLMRGTRAGRRRFILPTLIVFVIVLAVVTLIELGLGKPISDALRGQEGSGTTVFPSRVVQTPEPTEDPTEEPSPSDSPSETPSPTETPTGTPEPTETSPEPTESPETTTPAPTPTETPTPAPEPTTPEPEDDPAGDALDAQEPLPTEPTG